jgi:hypothetical protein
MKQNDDSEGKVMKYFLLWQISHREVINYIYQFKRRPFARVSILKGDISSKMKKVCIIYI